MNKYSQRRLFTILMTVFATTFCMAITGQVLGGQADLLADILKIAILIAVSTAVISYIVWTLTHLKKESLRRGVLAGLVTALMIVPLPSFVWTLKTDIFLAYKNSTENIFIAVFSALPSAIDAGLYTFVDITKASLLAVAASMVLGGVIARYGKPRPS